MRYAKTLISLAAYMLDKLEVFCMDDLFLIENLILDKNKNAHEIQNVIDKLDPIEWAEICRKEQNGVEYY